MIGSTTIIDFHTHNGRWDRLMQDDDPQRIISAMDAAGIDRACVFNIFHPDVQIGHQSVARVVRKHPDRFIGFAYATPLCGNMVEQTRHAIEVLGFAAIKIYPPYGDIRLTDDRWRPLFEFANEKNLPIISHTGIEPSCEPKYLGDIAPLYPRVNFVAGHSGNVQPQRDQACDAARNFPNVYIETCSTYRQPGVVEYLVERAGADKVLYGSDMPLMDPRCQIGKIITARLDDDTKLKILGRNAARLLKLRQG